MRERSGGSVRGQGVDSRSMMKPRIAHVTRTASVLLALLLQGCGGTREASEPVPLPPPAPPPPPADTALFLGLRTAIYPVPDLLAAREWYESVLGIEPYFNEPFYVGFDVGGFEARIGPGHRRRPGRGRGVWLPIGGCRMWIWRWRGSCPAAHPPTATCSRSAAGSVSQPCAIRGATSSVSSKIRTFGAGTDQMGPFSLVIHQPS